MRCYRLAHGLYRVLFKAATNTLHQTCQITRISTAGALLARSNKDADEIFKNVLSNVPQAVVVVTSAQYDSNSKTWRKRGATCSSFTGISLRPAIVSFALKKPSRLYDMLTDNGQFAVHVLATNQVSFGIHFARAHQDDSDQFEGIKHEVDDQGVPIIQDVRAVLHCHLHSVNDIGDHHICYGEVTESYTNSDAHEPLLYYRRTFRSVGDEAFMESFENTSLPFEDWTHVAHLRMAYNYLALHGIEKATPLIKNGIHKFNEKNKIKITRGYNETVTQFYINILYKHMQDPSNAGLTFDEFIVKNSHIQDKGFVFKYYSLETMTSKEAVVKWIPPDKQPI